MAQLIVDNHLSETDPLPHEQLQGLIKGSSNVLTEMGPLIQCINSYIADENDDCHYLPPSEDLIYEHAV